MKARLSCARSTKVAGGFPAPPARLYRRAEYDSARTLLSLALEVTVADDDSASEARILTILSLTANRTADYDDARVFGERSLEIKLTLGLNDELWNSYNALGLLRSGGGHRGRSPGPW